MKKNFLDWLALVLVIIGGLNWGLVGLFNYDLVPVITFSVALLTKTVYILVGLAAVYLIYFATKN